MTDRAELGKGTVANIVAAKLKWHILDSGAIYRAFALAASKRNIQIINTCLLYTSDAADDLLCVDLGGRRIIKKKK